MKKIVALLVALLWLLLGSALAEETSIVICNETIAVSETPKYLNVSETGSVNPGTESNYNVKLQLQNGTTVVTFKNANIQYNGGNILSYAGSSAPLTIIGEGKNTLKSTRDGWITLNSMSNMELKGSFDTITGMDTVIFSSNDITINANIQNLGQPESHAAIQSIGGRITIGGNIGRIQTSQGGLLAQKGDITINGTIGQIDYGEGHRGIWLQNGKLFINNSVGPIRASGSEVMAVQSLGGIELGAGISLLLPKNGKIDQDQFEVYRVYDENGNISSIAQFGKAAAPATGDGMNLTLWASLLTVSLIGIAVLSRKAKREY